MYPSMGGKINHLIMIMRVGIRMGTGTVKTMRKTHNEIKLIANYTPTIAIMYKIMRRTTSGITLKCHFLSSPSIVRRDRSREQTSLNLD